VEHYETVRMRKDGSLVDISLTVSPIRDSVGKVVGASKIIRDISRRKRHELELREATEALSRANDTLEERVKERTASLTAALAQMEEFSYTVFHDLKEPLHAIKFYARMLREDFATLLSTEEEAEAYVRRISEN